jgi:uncharacterized protein (TIGR02594 family)
MVSTKTTTALLMCSLVLATTPAFATGLESERYAGGGREIGALDEAMTTTVAPRSRAGRHHAKRYPAAQNRARHHAHRKPANWQRMGQVAVKRHGVAANAYASANPQMSGGFGGGSLVSEARRHLGGNPTGRGSLWCGHFMNLVLERSGHRPSGSNTARSFASYGTRISGPQVGAIAVMSRGKRGGHVGIVSGIDPNGNPIIISGNHNRRVAETVYPRGRIYAYVMP